MTTSAAAAETLGSADQTAVDAIVATLVHHLRKDHLRPSHKDPARRDAHTKHHGCVEATLEIRDDLPDDLRQGLFATKGRYRTWVRFSNALKVRHDLDLDARCMGIKVMGVEGATDGEG